MSKEKENIKAKFGRLPSPSEVNKINKILSDPDNKLKVTASRNYRDVCKLLIDSNIILPGALFVPIGESDFIIHLYSAFRASVLLYVGKKAIPATPIQKQNDKNDKVFYYRWLIGEQLIETSYGLDGSKIRIISNGKLL